MAPLVLFEPMSLALLRASPSLCSMFIDASYEIDEITKLQKQIFLFK